MGYSTIHLATQIPMARSIIESEEIDVAILDVNIHGKYSYPFATELAERGVPYVFATGYGDRGHPDEHRFVPTVTKPYSMEDIRSALDAAFARN